VTGSAERQSELGADNVSRPTASDFDSVLCGHLSTTAFCSLSSNFNCNTDD